MGGRTRPLSDSVWRACGERARGAGAVLLYGSVAVSMGFVNKATLMRFKYSNTVLLVQMLLTLVGVLLCHRLRVVKLRPFSVEAVRSAAPVAFFYNANVAFSLAALAGMNIPMYQTLKRTTPCIVLVVSSLMKRAWPPPQVSLSVATITFGTLVAGVGDFDFDMKAYTYALSSCVLQATYLLLAERSGSGDDAMSSTELLLLNSGLSAPFLFLVVFATGEWAESSVALLGGMSDPGLISMVVGAAAMGGILNFSLFLCTMLTSALTTTVTGAMKAVLMTALGFVLLGGVRITPVNFAGICINTIGGCWYSYAKYTAKRAHTAKESDAESCLEQKPV
eukprot:TRINITY_DN23503_c0_g1_i1.p1 TRINITY_DN23503_c0_g1~~TRINITY_DN23503_c0_g1_i1.p1  ORF type:complete len:355 (+),score=127.35 TRINITY_DN23503_c0_g1_i1:59-1066(+)